MHDFYLFLYYKNYFVVNLAIWGWTIFIEKNINFGLDKIKN